MIICIDGPSISGKSTVTRALAQVLHMPCFSTGLLYRALAYGLLGMGYDEHSITQPNMTDVHVILAALDYSLNDTCGLIQFHHKNITDLLRTNEISQSASILGINPQIRDLLNYKIRNIAQQTHDNIIIEGRDTGTVVFPKADYKFFLTASLDERARRLHTLFSNQGINLSLDEVTQQIKQRDERDINRKIDPLKKAEDAHEIDSSKLGKKEILQQVLSYIKP